MVINMPQGRNTEWVTVVYNIEETAEQKKIAICSLWFW